MEKHIEDLSKYRFNKANDCLNIAKKLFEGGEFGYAQIAPIMLFLMLLDL